MHGVFLVIFSYKAIYIGQLGWLSQQGRKCCVRGYALKFMGVLGGYDQAGGVLVYFYLRAKKGA